MSDEMSANKWIIPLIGSGILAGIISVSSSAGGLVQKMDSVADDVSEIDNRLDRMEESMEEGMDDIKEDVAEQDAQDKVTEARLKELEKRRK